MELMGKTIKCAVFDLDGTLLDTLEDLKEAVNFALRKRGRPTITLEETRKFVGNGVAKLVARALREGEKDPDFSGILADMRRYYAAHIAVRTRPYPGIPEALKKLRERGFKVAIVSNKPEAAVRRLARRFFPGLVDVALGDKPGRARKPEPDGVLEAVRLLGAKPSEALYIGDSEVDMRTARNTGLPVAAVKWGFREKKDVEPYRPELYAERPADLPKLLAPLRAPLRIGVFGGSFDPVHKVHLLIARRAFRQLELDLLLFVPAFRAPHKRNKIYADNGARCEMVAAALAGKPGFRVEKCEIERGGLSFTVDTLRELKKRLKPCGLFLVIGSDNYLGFSSWRAPEEIRKLARLAVYQRKGQPAAIAAPDLEIKGKRFDFSSSIARDDIARGTPDRKTLPAKVWKIIKQKKLYSS